MPSLMITDFGGLKTWPDDIHCYYFLVPRVPSHSHLVILGGAIIITLVDFLTMFLQNAFPSLTSMQFSTNNYHIWIHHIHKRNWKTARVLGNLGSVTKLSCLVMTFIIITKKSYETIFVSFLYRWLICFHTYQNHSFLFVGVISRFRLISFSIQRHLRDFFSFWSKQSCCYVKIFCVIIDLLILTLMFHTIYEIAFYAPSVIVFRKQRYFLKKMHLQRCIGTLPII